VFVAQRVQAIGGLVPIGRTETCSRMAFIITQKALLRLFVEVALHI
jgi:hypothetical protein